MAVNKSARFEKIESYKDLLEDQSKNISSSGHEWVKFLDCSSRFYKYNFEEQVLIYAQRPNATACAPLPLWNNTFDRRVSKGAKGIALLVEKPDGSDALRYVYDVSDTWQKDNRRIKVWKFQADAHTEVLRNTFGDVGEIEGQANAKDIIKYTVDYSVANIDLDYISDAGARFLARSVNYIIQTRCGLNDGSILAEAPQYFDDIQALGQAQFIYIATQIAEMSQDILREIEGAIKKYERQKYVSERGKEDEHRIQAGRGLSDTRPSVSGPEAGGQVRPHEVGLPEGVQERGIHAPAHGNGAESIPGRVERESIRESKSTSGAIIRDEPSAGAERSGFGMGQAHEQPQEPSRGNHAERTNISGGELDLKDSSGATPFVSTEPANSFYSAGSAFDNSQQTLFFDDEENPSPEPDDTLEDNLELDDEENTGVPITEDDIDYAFLKGRPQGSNYEIYQLLTDKDQKPAAIAKQIYKKYGSMGGHSHAFSDGSGWFNFSPSGIELRRGKEKVSFSWSAVCSRYLNLINSGKFISEDEIAIREGYYKPNPNLPPLSHDDIRRFMSHEFYLNNDNLRLYKSTCEKSKYSDLQGNDLYNFMHTTRSRWYRSGDGTTLIDVQKDSKGVLFAKNGSNLEFKSWDELYEIFRSKVLKGQFFSEEVIQRVYDQYADIIDLLDSTIAERNTSEPLSLSMQTPTDIELILHNYFTPGDVGEIILETGEKATYSASDGGIYLHFELKNGSTEKKPYWRGEAACAYHFIKSHDKNREVQPATAISSNSLGENHFTNHVRVNVNDPINYVITKDSLIGQGSAAEKARNNIAAIRTVKNLQKDNAKATPEQQEVLARYVGWGGLSKVFDESAESGWQRSTREELKELLTDAEYRNARASTLTAFYTSPVVIRSIYSALKQLGFEQGNILEPSMGVGNFFGLLPEQLRNSRLYGVEIDSISGEIAKQLYPKANVSICGYEKKDFPDNLFDVAVGNVPFGAFSVPDKIYDKNNFLIHDYFFAKTLDKVRPGGVVAFVTSKGTLDKANPQVRKYIAQRAELLGAIRLPNNAFAANAGTEVTSDIIFLQKREKQIDVVPEWVYIGHDRNGVVVNQYFLDNPQMILGTMAQQKALYGGNTETTCLPIPDMDLKVSLEKAISENIRGQISDYRQYEEDTTGEKEKIAVLPADPNVKNYSYALIDNEVYYRENSVMTKVTDFSFDNLCRLKHLVELRDIAKEIIELQLDGDSNERIQAAQSKLNKSYDRFAIQFGRINEKVNAKVFEKDSAYYLLCSLEEFDQNRIFVRKAPFFSQRTIRSRDIPDSAGSAADALALSIAEKAEVDMAYMSKLTGFDEQTLVNDLTGMIFVNPAKSTEDKTVFDTASEYLSGNIRIKLEQAKLAEKAFPGRYKPNVEALEKAMPIPLQANEIDVRLGSTWVDDEYIKKFIYETIMPKSWAHIEVEYIRYDSSWVITGKGADKDNNVRANSTYGTLRASAYEIIEDSLNLRDTRIYDTVNDPGTGKEKRVINSTETAKAQQKQEEIKQLFKDWIFKDPERREHLVNKYNELYNSIQPREYDGSDLKFYGMNPEIGLQKHQSDAVARILYGPNTLLAHEVGAGKTFVMAAGMMESKRIGLCKKSLWVVPNHLTEQAAAEFMSLYPGANILVATKKHFETKNRKKFCARIATGDYDAVIMGFSQFEKIPMSAARQHRMLEEQIDELVEMTEQLKDAAGMRTTVKRMEKTRRTLETRLEKLNDPSRKDDVVTFEELGIDRLVVDEAHNYKNLFFTTKMRNVAGLAQTEAQKSSDLYMKCRYMDEITQGQGIVFATGTPISNSMTEMYTLMSYLQGQQLRDMQLHHFDAWASSFGETVVAVELAPEGTGYRAKTRFSKFFNLPELMTLFKISADIKTADMLQLERPDANYHTISVEPTGFQKELMQSLSDRATKVHNKQVDPHEDNMLKITSDGRKIGLDQRLYDPLLPDQPGTKVNVCADKVYEIWEINKDKSSTQLVFCDFSTPSKDKFNLYDDLRDKLTKRGLPDNEIAFIHDADTEQKKADMFAKVRAGQIRVLLGSTAKMGAGTNAQDKLVAIHDLDCPWRPSDLEQRAGRIVRQGNTNKSVDIFRYVTKDTFDAYLYQTIENKQKFISQIMTSKSPVRSCEDVDESVLKYAEIKALCSGNPKIKEKMDLDVKVAKLQIAKSNYLSNRYTLENKILKGLPERIRFCEGEITELGNDWDYYQRHRPLQLKNTGEKQESVFAGITFEDRICTTKEAAGNKLLEIRDKLTGDKENVYAGEYMGFSIHMSYGAVNKEFYLTLKNKAGNGQPYSVSLGTDAHGNITRLDNALNKIESKLEKAKLFLEEYKRELAQCESDLLVPFATGDELKEALERLNVLNVELNLEHHDSSENVVIAEPDIRWAAKEETVEVKDEIFSCESKRNDKDKDDFSR